MPSRRPNIDYSHLLRTTSSAYFLNRKGLNNDLPYFIYPYDADLEQEAASMRKLLIEALTKESVSVLEINLFDLVHDVLEERQLWQPIIENEQDLSKPELLDTLQSVLDPKDYLVPAIAQKLEIAAPQLLILSGVGTVFPYIRSHNLLSNLQSAASQQLTLMFFPGDYVFTATSGATLNIFGLRQDDRFYRAINILDYEALDK